VLHPTLARYEVPWQRAEVPGNRVLRLRIPSRDKTDGPGPGFGEDFLRSLLAIKDRSRALM
jgi:hypothetical protein